MDLIVVVKNVDNFYKENLLRNPSHYPQPTLFSLVKDFGIINYHNVLISGQRIKYGVIEEIAFIKDLKDWNSFFIAGRLHKPTILLNHISNEWKDMVMEAQKVNLCNAMNIVDKINAKISPLNEMIEKSISLSYIGDIRGNWAENSSKIKNIFKGQEKYLLKMYETPLKERHLHPLPYQFDKLEGEEITNLIHSINRRSSIIHGLKGPCTIGFKESLVYFLQKLNRARTCS